MSVIVCRKRSFSEDLQTLSTTSSLPSEAKRLRCSSFNSLVPTILIDWLIATFPDMDNQVLEKALEECGYDLDSTIKRLNELRLGIPEGRNLGTVVEEHVKTDGEKVMSLEDLCKQSNLPVDGAEWVELFVDQMKNATSIDDARSRTTRALESLQSSIIARARAEATRNLDRENMILKEQIGILLRENCVLKRAVVIQHQRKEEYDERNQEVQQLKPLVAQYQEQLRNLEVNNYTLKMHLQQAQQGKRFYPDVF